MLNLIKIIGQGGPSNEIFAELWYNIASYWKNETNVVFGVYVMATAIKDTD